MRNHLQMGYPTDRGLFSSHPGNLTSTARSLGWSRDSSENGRYPLNGYSTCWTNMGKHWWTSGWNGVHTPFSDKAKLGMLEIWDVDTRRRSLFKNKSNIRHMRMCRKKKSGSTYRSKKNGSSHHGQTMQNVFFQHFFLDSMAHQFWGYPIKAKFVVPHTMIWPQNESHVTGADS